MAQLLDPVTVTIRGRRNTGKTTLASLLADWLKENGYRHVAVKDVPPTRPEDKPRFMERFTRNRDLRPVNIVVELEE